MSDLEPASGAQRGAWMGNRAGFAAPPCGAKTSDLRPSGGRRSARKSGRCVAHAPWAPRTSWWGRPSWHGPMDPVNGTVRSGSRLNRVLLFGWTPSDLRRPRRSGRPKESSATPPSARIRAAKSPTGSAVEQLLKCACHASKFDPSDGARVIEGPAPRPISGPAAGVRERTPRRRQAIHRRVSGSKLRENRSAGLTGDRLMQA